MYVHCSLDDATYATLSSLMLFNNVDVVLGLYQDAAFLPRVSSSAAVRGKDSVEHSRGSQRACNAGLSGQQQVCA